MSCSRGRIASQERASPEIALHRLVQGVTSAAAWGVPKGRRQLGRGRVTRRAGSQMDEMSLGKVSRCDCQVSQGSRRRTTPCLAPCNMQAGAVQSSAP